MAPGARLGAPGLGVAGSGRGGAIGGGVAQWWAWPELRLGREFRLRRPRGRAPLRRQRVRVAGVTWVTSARGSCRLRASCPDPCCRVLRRKAAPVTITAHRRMPGTARRTCGTVRPEPRTLLRAPLAAAPPSGVALDYPREACKCPSPKDFGGPATSHSRSRWVSCALRWGGSQSCGVQGMCSALRGPSAALGGAHSSAVGGSVLCAGGSQPCARWGGAHSPALGGRGSQPCASGGSQPCASGDSQP